MIKRVAKQQQYFVGSEKRKSCNIRLQLFSLVQTESRFGKRKKRAEFFKA